MSKFFIELIFSRKGPAGITSPFPIQLFELKQQIFKSYLIDLS